MLRLLYCANPDHPLHEQELAHRYGIPDDRLRTLIEEDNELVLTTTGECRLEYNGRPLFSFLRIDLERVGLQQSAETLFQQLPATMLDPYTNVVHAPKRQRAERTNGRSTPTRTSLEGADSRCAEEGSSHLCELARHLGGTTSGPRHAVHPKFTEVLGTLIAKHDELTESLQFARDSYELEL
jgi:hypothetical protein